MLVGGESATGRTGRRRIEAALARSPLQRVMRGRARSRLCVLAYHGVDDAARFERQLDWLAEHTSVLSLDEARRIIHGEEPRVRWPVLLTFDDGHRSVLDVAAPLLRERTLPAVAFVVAGLVDTDLPFWWVEAEALAPEGVRGADFVRRLKQMPDLERRRVLETRRRRTGRAVRTPQLTTDELRKLELDGVAVGNHSLTHPCLDRCDGRAVVQEVSEAGARLTDMLGHPPVAFAYPNGNWDDRVVRAVRSAGHDVAFCFDHRLVRHPTNPYTVSRVRADASAGLDRLQLLVSGLHPALHALRGRT